MSAGPRSRKLGTTVLVALGLGALGAAAIVSRRFLSPRPAARPVAARAAAAPSPSAPREETSFRVASATGAVEVQRGGLWLPIKKGDTLTRTDVVRTAAGGRAVLSLSAGTEIELRERVEIELDRLATGATVDLRRGKVEARVSGGAGLEITSRDTRTANEGPAHFVVLSDERGRVSVAALSGKAKFTAGGKSLTLPEGTESSSEGGAAPSDPEKIPEDVLLEVVWPAAEQRHGAAETEVAGRAAPSSVVTVNGARAAVGADGHFTATVPLRTGKNTVDVAAEDLAGRTRQSSATLVRRGPPPALTPEKADLWKK
ncbi:MAG TPA: FecR domain-containing protein [Polyangia bacterium]|nr:FecR domain-containing protein [Polyangia bacterium]